MESFHSKQARAADAGGSLILTLNPSAKVPERAEVRKARVGIPR